MAGQRREFQGPGSASLVVLIDDQGREIGIHDKLEAHRLGLRHLAFSVFLQDGAGRWLLQQRAAGKYHSPGLWANSCCGHPRHGERLQASAVRRVREELGVDARLRLLRHFSYRRDVGGGLVENELVAVFLGSIHAALDPDPEEVALTRWVEPAVVFAEMAQEPDQFTVWFREYVENFAREIPGASP